MLHYLLELYVNPPGTHWQIALKTSRTRFDLAPHQKSYLYSNLLFLHLSKVLNYLACVLVLLPYFVAVFEALHSCGMLLIARSQGTNIFQLVIGTVLWALLNRGMIYAIKGCFGYPICLV